MTSVVSLVTQNWNRNQNQKKNQPHSIVNSQNKKQPRFENQSKNMLDSIAIYQYFKTLFDDNLIKLFTE